MKKHFLIFPFAALALFSCGSGNQNQNQTTINTETTIATDNDVASDISTDSVPEMLKKFVNSLPQTPDKQIYHNSEVNDKNYSKNNCYAYPLKSGGYLTIFQHTEMNNQTLNAYTFKDGKFYTADNDLPIPDIKFLFRDDKTKGHEQDIKEITAIFNKHSRDFVVYAPNDKKPELRAKLSANFSEAEYKESYGEIIDYRSLMQCYQWNGEKFVFVDKFTEFMKSLPQTADKSKYQENDFYDLPWEMTSITEDYYAFPLKDGGYMGMFSYNGECEASMWWGDYTYIFKNGTLTKDDNILPVPEAALLLDQEKCKQNPSKAADITKQYNKHPKEYLLYSITENGNLGVSMRGNGCEQWGEDDLDYMKNADYKWDGEKFVCISDNVNVAAEVAAKIDINREEWNKGKSYGNLTYTFSNEFREEPATVTIYCYPFKTGGHFVVKMLSDIGDWTCNEYIYKDGVLKGTKDILPTCATAAEMLNPDELKGHEKDLQELEKLYKENPRNFICYWFDVEEQTVMLEFRPFSRVDWDEDKVETFFQMNLNPSLKYKWNGEKFEKE